MTDGELPGTRALWPDPKVGPWLVEATFAVVGGRAECVGLSMRSVRTPRPGPLPPGAQHWEDVLLAGVLPAQTRTDRLAGEPDPERLTARTWQSVPIGRLMDQLRRAWAQQARKAPRVVPLDAKVWQEAGTRRGVDLRDVADAYRSAWTSGDRAPTKAVAKQMHLTYDAAAKAVQRARRAGWLPRTSAGRADAHTDDGERS